MEKLYIPELSSSFRMSGNQTWAPHAADQCHSLILLPNLSCHQFFSVALFGLFVLIPLRSDLQSEESSC